MMMTATPADQRPPVPAPPADLPSSLYVDTWWHEDEHQWVRNVRLHWRYRTAEAFVLAYADLLHYLGYEFEVEYHSVDGVDAVGFFAPGSTWVDDGYAARAYRIQGRKGARWKFGGVTVFRGVGGGIDNYDAMTDAHTHAPTKYLTGA